MKKRIVVKIGTSSLTTKSGEGNFRRLDRLAMALADIKNNGNEVILVSSGAIAVGAHKMRLKENPKEMRMKQAAAAVGQSELMFLYDKFFGEYNTIVAQILLNSGDIEDAVKRENLSNTFNTLLEQGIIPIINENDSVGSEEIENPEKLFSDNDMLSAIVAVLVEADELIIMSDIDGLFDKSPALNPNAKLITHVDEITDDIRKLADYAELSSRGRGGMITKIQAAELATLNGIPAHIVNGKDPAVLYDLMSGKEVGTFFATRH